MIIASVSLAALILLSALFLTMACKGTYNFFVKHPADPYELGEAVIRQNYACLIDYTLSPAAERLELIGLPMSEGGRQHFREVRAIFQYGWIALAVSFLLSVLFGGISLRYYRTTVFLKSGGRLAAAFPLVLALPAALAFDRLFIFLHKLLFSNDLWIFDPATDPIICYLPEELFFKNLILILLWMLFLVGLTSLLRFFLRRKFKTLS